MKIAIDISQIIYETGVSYYTRNLVKNLLKIDKKNEYVLFGGSLRRRNEIKKFFHALKATGSEERKARRGVRFKDRILPVSPGIADLIWNRLHIFPVERLIGDIDVFHSSDWSQPPGKAFRVTTVHDLVPVLFPEQSDPKIVSVHKRRLKWVKNEADRVIVPSKATKGDLANLGFNVKDIRVIPEAPDEKFKPASEGKISKVKKEYGIIKKYLLSVGVAPRKNTKRIIEAYKRLNKEGELELLIIGHKYAEIEETGGVKILGHIDNENMPALYSDAEALVYPSLYEGFGLPILEAMACNCPVVTSNTSSMPEVAGDAAVLVNPKSTSSIARGIKKAIGQKQKYIESGKKRVKMFSWEKTARETLKVYEEGK